MQVKIRYNTKNTTDLYWRLLIQGVEHQVNSLKINTTTWTTEDVIETGEKKWHITCIAKNIIWSGDKRSVEFF